MTNLQSVDELGHWDFVFGVIKHAQGLKLGIVGTVLEFETNKVAEFGGGTTKKLKRQGGSVVGCTSCQ